MYPARTTSHGLHDPVPQVDADGNEVAGVRLPSIAVPLATHTGWNFWASGTEENSVTARVFVCPWPRRQPSAWPR